MEIPFESFSKLAAGVIQRLESGDPPLRELSIRLDKGAGNYLDLFALGRLLAFCESLRRDKRVQTTFICGSRARWRYLEELGFPLYCREHHLQCWPREQWEIDFGAGAEKSRVTRPILRNKTYWRCLVPLTDLPLQIHSSEVKSMASVNEQCSVLARQASERLRGAGIDPREMYPELSMIFFRILRELLSNAATHAKSERVLFAMTLSRETSPGSRAHRPGSPIRTGQDKYEILVMDLGPGVARTVAGTLNPHDRDLLQSDYFSLCSFGEALSVTRAKEESLLENIFRGDLVIRKGRKSEGLHDLGQTLSWFGGVLNYFTGRTELQLTPAGPGEVGCRARSQPSGGYYYLPGVIASTMLASHHVKASVLRAAAEAETEHTGYQERTCEMRGFDYVPDGLFGRMPAAQVNRKSEMDAESVTTEYERTGDAAEKPFAWQIDLKMSDNIDVGFLDNFIQELCKRQCRWTQPRPPLLSRLVFTNVPRDVVHALKRRNCESFLKLNNACCLILDGSDEPHFLGLPRVSQHAFDTEDALQIVLRAGTIPARVLQETLNLSSAALSHLGAVLARHPGGLFSYHTDGDESLFSAMNLKRALQEYRARHLHNLVNVRVYEGDTAAFRLTNETYVDAIYDFCLYWSDSDVLLACAKLLLTTHHFPLVDSLLAFMNNGDRFATALQRLSGASNLTILDPHDSRVWGDLSVQSDCIIVVDALYNGDEERGYVFDLLRRLHRGLRSEDTFHVVEVVAFCDFRTEEGPDGLRAHRGPLRVRLDGVERELRVSSVDVWRWANVPLPRRVWPRSDLRLLRNSTQGYYILPKPRPESDRNPAASGNGGHGGRRTGMWASVRSTEMTTEFWQNISSAELLDTRPQGREKRTLLFFEHTERLVQHPRMRRIVTQFVSNYVKARLNSKIDVILHPIHPIGAFLAQLVASQLSRPPLILPVTQRAYGGRIELTPEDYSYFRLAVEAGRARLGRPLRALVIDDSVLSGSSLFTMLGVAAELGLRGPHILVLVNRLTAEVTEAVERSADSFTYLYRFRMPLLSELEVPDEVLQARNNQVLENSNSYFGQMWASRVESNDERFSMLCEGARGSTPPTLGCEKLEIVADQFRDTYKLRQIVEQLLLHPDSSVLDFQTRVAISYNFLEQLVNEKVFWATLRELVLRNMEDDPRCQSIQLVRSVVFLLSSSRHIHPFVAYLRFQDLCEALIVACLANRGRWTRHHELVSECLMALGVIGSERLWHIGAGVLHAVVGTAMSDVNPLGSDRGGEGREAARSIVGSFAWGLSLLTDRKGAQPFSGGDAVQALDQVLGGEHPTEIHLLLIDVLEAVLEQSQELRSRLQITRLAAEDSFLDELRSDPASNELSTYLERAPGYTCTLKTILRVTGASTILLYMGNSDDDYFLRALETKRNRPDDVLNAKDLPSDMLPGRWQARMREELFFSSEERSEVERLDVFNKGETHQWSFGGAVNTASDMRYYVVLGFAETAPTPQLQSTAYYYWLKCEALLRDILPEIHRRHVGSSSAWNTLVQSIGPIHPIVLRGSPDSPVYKRRSDLQLAMASVNVGDFVRRAVGVSAAPVCGLDVIRTRVLEIASELRQMLTNVDKRYAGHDYLLRELTPWPSMAPVAPLPPEQYISLGGTHIPFEEEESTFAAFHLPVLEFITYEVLCNTLSYFHTPGSIKIEMHFSDGGEYDQLKRLWVELRVTNDIHHSMEAQEPSGRTSNGVHACAMAAAAVGGHFESSLVDNRRVTYVKLPAYRVPSTLTKRLHGYLN